MTTHVWYHANCYDGFGAAWAAWKKLGDRNVVYTPVKHGKPPPAIAEGDHVYILDFSYDRQTLLDLNERAGKLQVIDHHKSAAKELGNLDFAIFDNQHSGAVLSWWYFNDSGPAPGPPPLLLEYVQDRDLWVHELQDSKAVNLALRSHAMDFGVWDNLSINQLKLEGHIIQNYQDRLVDLICERACLTQVLGHMVMIVSSACLASEVCNELLIRHSKIPFAVSYYDTDDGRLYELRSRKGGFDVSEIATGMGGGGHQSAAGFTVKSSDLLIGHPSGK